MFTDEVVVGLIETLVSDYLGYLDIELWNTNSEDFVEREDDLHIIKDSNME